MLSSTIFLSFDIVEKAITDFCHLSFSPTSAIEILNLFFDLLIILFITDLFDLREFALKIKISQVHIPNIIKIIIT